MSGWGIIRYAAGSGLAPEDDCAAFDGWYADREEAVAVYHDMCKRCPRWIVALVQAHEVRFSNLTWGPVARDLVARDQHTLCPLKKDGG